MRCGRRTRAWHATHAQDKNREPLQYGMLNGLLMLWSPLLDPRFRPNLGIQNEQGELQQRVCRTPEQCVKTRLMAVICIECTMIQT
jgi:hypothetical protein